MPSVDDRIAEARARNPQRRRTAGECLDLYDRTGDGFWLNMAEIARNLDRTEEMLGVDLEERPKLTLVVDEGTDR
jgi:hypothetical protein